MLIAAAPVTVEEFDTYANLLKGHDWYYNYSDDYSVWRAGQKSQEELYRKSNLSDELREAYSAYSKWIYGGRKGESPLIRMRKQLFDYVQ